MADVEAVMKKYDRESNTRIWTGVPEKIIRYLMAAFAVYCIIDAIFLTTLQEVRYTSGNPLFRIHGNDHSAWLSHLPREKRS